MTDDPLAERADALLLLLFDNLGIDFDARKATRDECKTAILDALSGTKLDGACLDTYQNWTGETYVCTLEAGHGAKEINHRGPTGDARLGSHEWHFRYIHGQTPQCLDDHEWIIDRVCVEIALKHARTQYHNMCSCGEHLVPKGFVLNAGVTNNEVTYEAFMLAHVTKVAAEMAFRRAIA